jgi:WD40 repeat protein/predicted Ser/Thr protein kinase
MPIAPPQQSERAARLEEAALAILQGADPQALLDANPDLAEELRAFIAAGRQIDGVVAPLRAAAAAGPEVPGRIGAYEILEKIAEGGMGVVYRARQDGTGREVALKLIKGSSPEDVERFRIEARIVAGLTHAHIVRLYEVGEHEGKPFFSMEYVTGGSLSKKVPELQADPKAAASLLRTVAQAVHHAHQHGLIHRDLKPSNILLDDKGEPHVADFGLAKRVEDSPDRDPTFTPSNAIVGTPPYMPPEQARGARHLTTAADVYGLGAILYHLLTARPPFDGVTPMDVLLKVCSDQPPEPPRRLNPKVERDLETICLKCLQKDPARRYESARALAKDLRRYLEGRPITARRVSLPERGWKWVRRQPVLAALVAAVVLLVLVAVFGIGSEWSRTEKALEKEKRERYVSQIGDAAGHAGRGESGQAVDVLEECAGPLRGWEWRYLRRLCRLEVVPLTGHKGPVLSVQYRADGARVITAGHDGTARVWDAATGKQLLLLPGNVTRTSAWFTGDDRIVTGGEDGTVQLWDAATGAELTGDRRVRWGRVLTAARHGSRIALYSDGVKVPEIVVWDTATRKDVQRFRAAEALVNSLALSPDGRYLAACGYDGYLKVWDVDSRREMPLPDIPRAAFAAANSWTVAFNHDGTRAAVGTTQPLLWDVQTGATVDLLPGAGDLPSGSVSFSPDGTWFAATGSRDGQVRIWNLRENGVAVRGPSRQGGGGPGVVFSPDGQTVAVPRGAEVTLEKLFARANPSGPTVVPQPAPKVGALAFHPQSSSILAVRTADKILLWDVSDPEAPALRRGASSWALPAPAPEGANLAFSPDRELLASGCRGSRLAVWDLEAGKPAATTIPAANVRWCAFGPGGLLATTDETRISLWDLAKGGEPKRFPAPAGTVAALAFDRDGRFLAAGGDSQRVQLFDVSTGRPGRDFRGPTGTITSLAFSPDGKQLAAGSADLRVCVWDVAGGERLFTWGGHGGSVTAVAYSPDGKRLASCGNDGTVKLWDLVSGHEVLSLAGHRGHAACVAFSPDGNLLASCGYDGTVRLWDGRPLDGP